MAPIPTPTTTAIAISSSAVGEVVALRARGGRRERDEQQHERRRDAVVEPALDVEDAPDPDRDGRVRDDREAQGGVGRGQDRPDEQRGRERKLREDQRADEPAGGDRQEEPDPEQATDQAGVAPETGEVDRRGIREQHERERELGKLPDRRRLDVDVQHAQHIRPEHEPGTAKNTSAGPIDSLVESVGDERVARQEQDEHRDPDLQVPPPPTRPDGMVSYDGRLFRCP